jgi:putative tryptophan/tyrosine transport system substrate-binding protein
MPVVGFLSSLTARDATKIMDAFHRGLADAGYVEGQNVAIEYRWAAGKYDRLAAMAAELVHLNVTAIAAVRGTPAGLAAKAATTTIPIVFVVGGDPIAHGLVTSFNRPTGNITGASFFNAALAAKRLELLGEFVPKAITIAVLVNRKNPASEGRRRRRRSVGAPQYLTQAPETTSTMPSWRSVNSKLVRFLLALIRSS